MSNSHVRRPTRCSFVRDGGRGSHLLPFRLSFNRASNRARPNPGFVETVRRSLLLAGDGLRLALAGAGVGVGALAAHRQLLAMTQAAIGAQIHQPLDVDRDFAAKVAFDHIVTVDCLANLQNFGIGQLRDTPLRWDMHLLDNLFSLLWPDAVDILKRDDHALVGGDINACNASHSPISISAALDVRNLVPRQPSRRPVEAGPCRESRVNAKSPMRSEMAPGPRTTSGWAGCRA